MSLVALRVGKRHQNRFPVVQEGYSQSRRTVAQNESYISRVARTFGVGTEGKLESVYVARGADIVDISYPLIVVAGRIDVVNDIAVFGGSVNVAVPVGSDGELHILYRRDLVPDAEQSSSVYERIALSVLSGGRAAVDRYNVLFCVEFDGNVVPRVVAVPVSAAVIGVVDRRKYLGGRAEIVREVDDSDRAPVIIYSERDVVRFIARSDIKIEIGQIAASRVGAELKVNFVVRAYVAYEI